MYVVGMPSLWAGTYRKMLCPSCCNAAQFCKFKPSYALSHVYLGSSPHLGYINALKHHPSTQHQPNLALSWT